MNKMNQKLKKKCISLVLFALLAAFIVPYYADAAGNGTESATEVSAADRAGDFSMSEGESSKEKVEEDSSEDEQKLTKKNSVSEDKSFSNTESASSVSGSAGTTSGQAGTDEAEASKNVEADTQESTEEKQTLTKEEIKTVRKNLQLGRSYGFYVYGAEESATQSFDEKDGVAVQAAEAEVLSPDVDTVLSKVRSYILSKDTKPDYSSIWNVVGLKRSGLYVPESYTNLFYSNVIAYCESKDWELTRAKYSDYSKLILALTAIGVDARDVMGHNLLSYLSDYKNVSRQGNNGPIWALIALKSNPAYTIPKNSSAEQQNSEELLVKKVVEMQCADGGWTLMGSNGDSDMTGMAMQALASYYNKAGYEDVTAAINKGLTWISKNQLSSGGFGTMGTETSESVAQIITALCGVGIDCGKDSRFIKENGKWPMTGLFQYYMSEGGFMHVAAGAGNNGGGAGGTIDGMATEQGLYATVAYRRLLDGDTFLYDMSDVEIAPGTKPVVSPTINTGSGGSSTTTTTKKTETQPSATKVKVIKVGLNYSTIYLTKGKSKTLKATVSPSNAANKSVSWTSSNKKVATVSSKGKVTGKKAGTATITVKAKDGSGKKATCKVVVTAAATATTAKKTTTTTAARSQTKRITTPVPSGTTNRSGSTGTGSTGTSSVPAASGTTKTLPSGSSSGGSSTNTATKGATGTTAKKKNTAAEANTGGWSFSGDNYVPDTYSDEGETDAAEATTAVSDEDTSSKSKHINPTVLYVAGGGCGLAVGEALGFVVYKKRKSIAGGIAGIVSKLHRDGDAE